MRIFFLDLIYKIIINLTDVKNKINILIKIPL